MTSLSRTVYNDELNNIVDKYNNTYHRTKIMKPIDVRDSIHISHGVENDVKYPNFEVGDHVRLWQYINIFGKGNTPNYSEDIFTVRKVKNTGGGFRVSQVSRDD